MRISLFITCFNDLLFPETGAALVRILEKLGHQVVFPRDQTCCGQIHLNTGYKNQAFHLLRRFVRVFGEAEAVVAPSASCVAMVHEQYPHLARETEEPGLISAVEDLVGRTFEMSSFLVNELGVEGLGAHFPHRVALHPTCHSLRGIDVGDAPLRLLRAVEGLELVELPDAEECCGFGGTFSVKNPHTSLAMLEDKMSALVRSGAGVFTAVDNSCLAHIAGGLHRAGLLEKPDRGGLLEHPDRTGLLGRRSPRMRLRGPVRSGLRVVHLAEILASDRRAVV